MAKQLKYAKKTKTRKIDYSIEKYPPLIRLKRSLTTENLWIYILSLLSKKPKSKLHGYTLSEEIEKKFKWKPGFITPYIVIYRLESEGYVKSVQKGRRVEYKITKKGRNALKDAKKIITETYKSI